MSRKDIEQLILIVWTFTIITLDLINYEVEDVNVYVFLISTIIAAVIYYVIGLVILKIINFIHK